MGLVEVIVALVVVLSGAICVGLVFFGGLGTGAFLLFRGGADDESDDESEAVAPKAAAPKAATPKAAAPKPRPSWPLPPPPPGIEQLPDAPNW